MNTTRNRHRRSGSSTNRNGRNDGFRRNTRSGYGRGKRSGFGGRNRNRGGRKLATFDPSQFINTNPVAEKEEVYTPTNTFASFGVNAKLTQNITELGLTTPSPIQDKIIPEILAGHDVVGLAQTGTGKTAAFLIPLIEKTVADTNRQTLILAPTRELALQIEGELKKLAAGQSVYWTTCVGGMNIGPQIRRLRRKNHFIIGTPGRVLDLIRRTFIRPAEMSTVVLDEADRMLDMGFIVDMRTILSALPEKHETLFFSATMTPEAEKLVSTFMQKPVTISVKKKDVTNSISQDVVRFARETKFETLTNLLQDDSLSRVLIFGEMKHSVEKLANDLTHNGVNATSIHGNKSHPQRQRALKQFKDGNARVLVATDVAARGIHVDDVSHVINYDLPQTFEDYVHRIGRTGRGSKRGKALTFVKK